MRTMNIYKYFTNFYNFHSASITIIYTFMYRVPTGPRGERLNLHKNFWVYPLHI